MVRAPVRKISFSLRLSKTVHPDCSISGKLLKMSRGIKGISVNWPKITYLGSIGGDKKSRVAMLTIDNKEVFVALNNTLNGIKVSKIYADSVTLVFEKQTKTITIN
jgi:hypothetical protein